MKRCGIATLIGFFNYGNRLQNYAIVQVLRKLNYKPVNFSKSSRFSYYKNNLSKLLRGKISFESFQRFNRFMHTDLKMIKSKYVCDKTLEGSKKVDYLLLGSDQIWNPNWGDEYYFGNFADPKKRIAFVASFGLTDIPEDKKSNYIKYLNEMKAISVREEAGAEIVKALTGRDAEVLIDPTMMISKEEWHAVAKKPSFKIDKKYVLTYFLGEVSEKRQAYVKSVCEKYDLSLIDLTAKNQNKYWNKTDPMGFIWLIEHCSLMLTDSFHGTVFSILMEVPFLVFEREDSHGEMSSRLQTLLKKFDLQDNIFKDEINDNMLKADYSHIPEILKAEREKTISFLKNAMESGK